MARKPMEKGLQNGPGQIRVNAYNVNYVSPPRARVPRDPRGSSTTSTSCPCT